MSQVRRHALPAWLMKFLEKKKERWQSWSSWHNERQKKKGQQEPAANKRPLEAGPKPAGKKKEKRSRPGKDKLDYKCDICDKLFEKKIDLEWHLQEHTGVLPLRCGLCPMKFLNGRLLKGHYTRHHGLSNYPGYCSRRQQRRSRAAESDH